MSPAVIDAFMSAQEALAGDSNDKEHDALLALVEALEGPNLAADVPLSVVAHHAAMANPIEGIRMAVPTYNGKWLEEYPTLQEYDEPEVPVLICRAEGVRVILGTHDYHDYEKSDIQVERRHNGWMIFLHPFGGCDACGYVIMLDDGRSFVTPERGAGDYGIQMVDYDEAMAELDDIKPSGLSCAPTMIVNRDERGK